MWGQRVACTRGACITRVLCTRGDWISWQPQYFGTSLVGSYVEAKDAMCGRRTIKRFRSVGVSLGEDCASIRHIGLTSVWQRACLVSWWLGIACVKHDDFGVWCGVAASKNCCNYWLRHPMRPSTRNVIMTPPGNPQTVMWPVVRGYFSNMFRPAQFHLQSGYQVLPPHRRWDLRRWQLRVLGRKNRDFNVIGGSWRCCAQEFLWGLRRDFEMAVGSGRSTLGSEIEKSWRDYYKCLRHSLIANGFKSWCFWLFLPLIWVWVGSRVAVWVHLNLCYWVGFLIWHRIDLR